MRKGNAFAALATCVLVLLCAVDFAKGKAAAAPPPAKPLPSPVAVTEPPPVPVVMTVKPDVLPTPMTVSQAARKGSGTISYGSNPIPLPPEQEALILGLMDAYYTSLANLEVESPRDLYVLGDALSDETTLWEVVIGIRSMAKVDLSLTTYRYALSFIYSNEEDNGDVEIRVSENFIQRFAAFPGVDSRGMNVVHQFTLTETMNGWRIKEHRQIGSQNRVVFGGWRPSSGSRRPESKAAVLAEAEANIAAWKTQGTDPGEPAFAYPYDREAAVSYARYWVGERSPDWVSYDRSGGNCQNFTSQAILAGGIPMDVVSPGLWKWYGGVPNSSFTASGRSASWSSVSEFLAYAGNNAGYGLVAAVDAPYYTGEEGDVIHLGTDGDWRHTVMITKVIRDRSGNVVDYLVASNTADLVDYPVSAYHYTQQMLIKIYGWNG